MIGKGFRRAKAAGDVETKGFDAFELRLGDLMRGERATMGKSLLDVQRELKIKAAYIAAIENADPTAFDTPGFIAGYVRSYARYLGMEPDWAFDTFCKESGFATAHGMSAEASSVKPTRDKPIGATGKDIFSSSATPFIPANDSFLSKVEPGAVGSVLVLAAVIAALGYGGWTVLQEVQKVQLARSNRPRLSFPRSTRWRVRGPCRWPTRSMPSICPRPRRLTGFTARRRWMCRFWSRATRRFPR